MAYAKVEYPYSGGPQVFSTAFGLGTLEPEYIVVLVAGSVDGLGDPIQYAHTYDPITGDVTVTDPIPSPYPATVKIARITPITQLYVDFEDGADVTKRNLSLSTQQVLMAVQELYDSFETAVNLTELAEEAIVEAQAARDIAVAAAAAAAASAVIADEAADSVAGFVAAAMRTTQAFPGNGTVGPYPLDFNPGATGEQIDVYYNAAWQALDDHYTIVEMVSAPSGYGIIFDETVLATSTIWVRYVLPVPADSTSQSALAYASRAELEAWELAGNTVAPNRVVDAGGDRYQRTPGLNLPALNNWSPANGVLNFTAAGSAASLATDFDGYFSQWLQDCSANNWLARMGTSADPYEVQQIDVPLPGDLRLDLSGSRIVGKTDWQQFSIAPGQTVFTITDWPYAANGTSAIVVAPDNSYVVVTDGSDYTIAGQVVTFGTAPEPSLTGYTLYIGQRSAAINFVSSTRSRLYVRGGWLDLSSRGYIETQASGSGWRLNGWGSTYWDGAPHVQNMGGRWFDDILDRRSDAAWVINDCHNTELHGISALGMCDATVYATGGGDGGSSADDGFGLKIIGGWSTRCNIDIKDTRQGASLQITGRTARDCKAGVTSGIVGAGIESARNYQVTNYMAFRTARRAFDIRDIARGSYIQARIEDWGRNPDGTEFLLNGVNDSNAAFFSNADLSQINLNISHRSQDVPVARPAIQFSGVCNGNTVTGTIADSDVGIAETGGDGGSEYANYYDTVMVDVDTKLNLSADTNSDYKLRVVATTAGVVTSATVWQNAPYKGRNLLSAALLAGYTPKGGLVLHAGRETYIGSIGAVDITDMPGVIPLGKVSPAHWAGDSGGAVNAYTAIMAADVFCRANDARILNIDGRYRTTSKLDLRARTIECPGAIVVDPTFVADGDRCVVIWGRNSSEGKGRGSVHIFVHGDAGGGVGTMALGQAKGTFDPATGTFPAGATLGDTFIVISGKVGRPGDAAGTLSGQAFLVNQRLVATVVAPSTTVFAGNWAVREEIAAVRVSGSALPFTDFRFEAEYVDTVLHAKGNTERGNFNVAGAFSGVVVHETSDGASTPDSNRMFVRSASCGISYMNSDTCVADVHVESQNQLVGYNIAPLWITAQRYTAIGGTVRTPRFGGVLVNQLDAASNCVDFRNLSFQFPQYASEWLMVMSSKRIIGRISAASPAAGAWIRQADGMDLDISVSTPAGGTVLTVGDHTLTVLNPALPVNPVRSYIRLSLVDANAAVNSIDVQRLYDSTIEYHGQARPIVSSAVANSLVRSAFVLPVSFVTTGVGGVAVDLKLSPCKFRGQATAAQFTAFTSRALGMQGETSDGIRGLIIYSGVGATAGWQKPSLVDL